MKRVYVTYPASRVEVETDLDNLISIFMISNFNVKTKSWNFSSDDVACFSLFLLSPTMHLPPAIQWRLTTLGPCAK